MMSESPEGRREGARDRARGFECGPATNRPSRPVLFPVAGSKRSAESDRRCHFKCPSSQCPSYERPPPKSGRAKVLTGIGDGEAGHAVQLAAGGAQVHVVAVVVVHACRGTRRL